MPDKSDEFYIWKDIDGLMQKRRNSIALAMELRLFGIKPSIYSCPDLCKTCSIITNVRKVIQKNKNTVQHKWYRHHCWEATYVRWSVKRWNEYYAWYDV